MVMEVELVPLEVLRPHEQIIERKVDQLERMTHRWNAYTKPLLLDRTTGTILDGHHRYHVAQRIDLQCVPCVLINFIPVFGPIPRIPGWKSVPIIIARSIS